MMFKDGFIDGIEAQLTEGDVEKLTMYTRKIHPPHVYLEVGVRKGGSAAVVMNAINNEEVQVYGVDIEDVNEFHHPRFHFIHKPSVEAAKDFDKPIQTLFIDADHDKAKEDFLAWENHVVPGGYVLFHDCVLHSPRVMKDCDELFTDNPNYRVISRPPRDWHPDSSIFVVQKCLK